jgi:hypothetical protein
VIAVDVCEQLPTVYCDMSSEEDPRRLFGWSRRRIVASWPGRPTCATLPR